MQPYRITTRKASDLRPVANEMESAKGKASAAAALFVISSVNRLVMTNINSQQHRKARNDPSVQ